MVGGRPRTRPTACDRRLGRGGGDGAQTPAGTPPSPTTRLGDRTGADAPAEGTVRLPDAPHLLRVEGAAVVIVRFDGTATLTDAGGAPTISFPERRRVTVAVADRADRPETVTVPRTPEGVATALSAMPAGHLTATADRSLPEMRAQPPRVEFGEEVSVPDSVVARRPDPSVVLELPPSLDYLVPAASLAHYLGAEVRVADDEDASPTLRTASLEHEFDSNPGYQTGVACLLRRTFLLDCLVRGAGPNCRGVAETALLDEVDLDAESLYRADPGDRLDAYLDVPFEEISGRLPDWHLSMYVSATYDQVRSLPHLLQNVPNVFLPEAKPLGTDERLSRSLDDFYRADAAADDSADDHAREAEASRAETGDVPEVTPVKPVLGAGRVHGWLADGVPIDVFKSTHRASNTGLATPRTRSRCRWSPSSTTSGWWTSTTTPPRYTSRGRPASTST
ncbi:hypothetical protein [Halogeometricum sp. CBA1124]|uniref:hypothetical protein n=1 Tax=Halogeometricum sp. CBA1124 TaxID=2668071 RepID=UPI0018D20743|nr:hypothetical protein [Halogeometricum sp. CBA1124]